MAEKQKAQLHAVLAVVPGLKATTKKVLEEARHTFTQKGEHFGGFVRTYDPKEEGGETLPPEDNPVVTTVGEKLKYLEQHLIPDLNARFQVDATNLKAVADVMVGENGEQLLVLENVPATFLMQFDKFLSEMRAVYGAIPTTDPKQLWKEDPQADRKGIYATAELTQNRKVKRPVPLELAKATDKHPAQVQLINEDVLVGIWTTRKFSGAITPRQKSDLLHRIDLLQRAVKRALSAANRIEHDLSRVGKKLVDFVHGDLV